MFVLRVCLMGILKYMCVFGCAVFIYSYRVLIGMCAVQWSGAIASWAVEFRAAGTKSLLQCGVFLGCYLVFSSVI